MLTGDGLSNSEVLRQLEEDGFNELPLSSPARIHHFLIELAREPMVFLLVACGAILLNSIGASAVKLVSKILIK